MSPPQTVTHPARRRCWPRPPGRTACNDRTSAAALAGRTWGALWAMPAGSLTLYSRNGRSSPGRTLEEGLAGRLVWLMAPALVLAVPVGLPLTPRDRRASWPRRVTFDGYRRAGRHTGSRTMDRLPRSVHRLNVSTRETRVASLAWTISFSSTAMSLQRLGLHRADVDIGGMRSARHAILIRRPDGRDAALLVEVEDVPREIEVVGIDGAGPGANDSVLRIA